MESGYASIDIGGTLRRADIDRFVKTAIEDYCYPSNGWRDPNADAEQDLIEEIEAAAEEKRPIRLSGDDVPWAQFDSLEALCQKLGLTYKRESSALPGVCGDLISFWAPDDEAEVACDEGAIMLSLATIRAHRRDGTLEDVLDRLERIEKFDIPLVLEGSMADAET